MPCGFGNIAAGSDGCLEDSYMATSPWALNAWDAWLVISTCSGVVYLVSFSIDFFIAKVWYTFPGSGSGSSLVYRGILSGSWPLTATRMIHSRAHCRMKFLSCDELAHQRD